MKEADTGVRKLTGQVLLPVWRAPLAFLGLSGFILIKVQMIRNTSFLELCMLPTCAPKQGSLRVSPHEGKACQDEGVPKVGTPPVPSASLSLCFLHSLIHHTLSEQILCSRLPAGTEGPHFLERGRV